MEKVGGKWCHFDITWLQGKISGGRAYSRCMCCWCLAITMVYPLTLIVAVACGLLSASMASLVSVTSSAIAAALPKNIPVRPALPGTRTVNAALLSLPFSTRSSLPIQRSSMSPLICCCTHWPAGVCSNITRAYACKR